MQEHQIINNYITNTYEMITGFILLQTLFQIISITIINNATLLLFCVDNYYNIKINKWKKLHALTQLLIRLYSTTNSTSSSTASATATPTPTQTSIALITNAGTYSLTIVPTPSPTYNSSNSSRIAWSKFAASDATLSPTTETLLTYTISMATTIALIYSCLLTPTTSLLLAVSIVPANPPLNIPTYATTITTTNAQTHSSNIVQEFQHLRMHHLKPQFGNLAYITASNNTQ